MIDLIVGSALAVIVLVVRLLPAFRRKRMLLDVARMSERSGLAIAPDILPVLIRRRRAVLIGSALGTAVGLEAGVVLQTVADVSRAGLVGALLPQVSWLLGGGVGALLGGALGARSVQLDGTRTARARAVTVEDYVEPVERRAAWLAAAIAGAVALVPLLHGDAGLSAALAAGIVAVVAVGAAELMAHRVVSRPHRADTVVALAWDDALRSESVRGLIEASAAIALLTLVASLPPALVAVGVQAVSIDVQLWTLTGVTAVLLLGGIWTMGRLRPRHFLQRLWPGTAAQLAENERPMEVQR